MTPTQAIIEETIRLQRQTNILQAVNLGLIFLANIFVALCVLNIRKTIRNLREWADANRRWSDALSDAQAIEARRAETENTGSVGDESAVAKPCAQPTTQTKGSNRDE